MNDKETPLQAPRPAAPSRPVMDVAPRTLPPSGQAPAPPQQRAAHTSSRPLHLPVQPSPAKEPRAVSPEPHSELLAAPPEPSSNELSPPPQKPSPTSSTPVGVIAATVVVMFALCVLAIVAYINTNS